MSPRHAQVRYIGAADVREISGADWRRVGAAGQKTTTWSAANDFAVLVADLSDAAVAWLAEQSDFSVSRNVARRASSNGEPPKRRGRRKAAAEVEPEPVQAEEPEQSDPA